jgi:transposase
VWRQPGDRVKTDPRDARRLAGQFAGGMLEAIFVPPVEMEALRDLVRAREDARHDRMRARARLGKFLLRQGRSMPTQSWSIARRAWLGQQRFDEATQQAAFDDYVCAVDLVDRRIELLERHLQDAANDGPQAELIARLRCLRGIDTLTAVGLVAEIGDFERFASAERFMSFVGLVPSERSSKRPGITVADRAGATPCNGAAVARIRSSSSARCAPSSACTGAGRGCAAVARTSARSSSPSRASSLASSGPSRPTSHSPRSANRRLLGPRQRRAAPEENPRALFAAPSGDPRFKTEAAPDGSSPAVPNPRMSV